MQENGRKTVAAATAAAARLREKVIALVRIAKSVRREFAKNDNGGCARFFRVQTLLVRSLQMSGIEDDESIEASPALAVDRGQLSAGVAYVRPIDIRADVLASNATATFTLERDGQGFAEAPAPLREGEFFADVPDRRPATSGEFLLLS